MSVMRRFARLGTPLALLLAACGAAHGADVEYQVLTLPGFSIEVPKGNVVKNVGTTQAGAYELAYLPANRRDKRIPLGESVFRLNVSWIARTTPRADWLRYVEPSIDAPGAFSEFDLRVRQDIGKDRWLGVRAEPAMETDQPFTAIGLVECNPRFSVTIIFTFHEDAGAQASATERILRSVKCDPATAQLAIPEAGLALPATFKRVPDKSLQRYAASDGSTVHVTFMPQNVLRRHGIFFETLRMQSTDHFDTDLDMEDFQGLQSTETGLERLNNALFVIHSGKLAGTFVRVRYCPGPQLTFFAFLRGASGKPPAEETARAMLDTLQCPGNSK